MPTSNPIQLDPAWLIEARKYLGQREIPGTQTNTVIGGWLRRLRAWWDDDETPWCGVFVAACLDACGYHLPANWMRAKAWIDWGRPCPDPEVGAVVIFARDGGGHVGFVVGRDEKWRLLVLGGNQGNAVSIAPFELSRVLAYRWPDGVPMPGPWPLPVYALGKLPASSKEA